MARRPRPSLRALLFRCGERALCEPWRLEDRSWRPWPAGPVRPSGPCCFGVAIAPCVSFGGWKTGQTASFLVGSESNVRHWGRWPAGPVRPSGPCCSADPACSRGSASEESFGGWKTGQTASFLVSNVRHWGRWPAGPVRPSGPCYFGVAIAPCVSFGGWKTALAAGRQRQLAFL